MNPFRWKRENQLAWVLVTLLGAIIVVLLGWLWSPLSHPDRLTVGQAFIIWIGYPTFYWPWFAFGEIVAALAFYVSRLLANSN
jgi:hypothetical protein